MPSIDGGGISEKREQESRKDGQKGVFTRMGEAIAANGLIA